MLNLLFACAAPDPVAVADRALTPEFAGKVSKSTTLTVEAEGDAAAYVQLVQVRGSSGAFTRYSTLATKAVSSGAASFSLTASPGSSYLSDGGGTSAIFVVVLLDDSGAIVGLADDVVGYYSTAPSGTASTGWLVGEDGLHGTPDTYTTLTAGIEVEDALAGDDEVSLRGSASTESYTSRARMQASPVDDDAVPPWDEAIAKKWSVTLSGTPDEASVRSDDGYGAAYFPLEVYDDANGNADWDAGEEEIIGGVCHGSADVVVRWVAEEDEDLDAVYVMLEHRVTYGWTVGELSGTRLSEITDATSLRVRDEC